MIAGRSSRSAAVAAALAAVVLAAAGYAWKQHRDRVAAVARESVPAAPDLSGWPADYAARAQTASALARRGARPLEALGELARLYHANGCYREAQQVETGLHALQPKDAYWTYLLADTCQNLGDPDRQESLLEEMLQLAPSYSVTQLKLAELLFKLGRIDEARSHYEWRLTLVPGDAYAQLGLARIALQQGNQTEAVAQLEALVRRSPNFSAAHNLLAGLYDRMGDTARAEQHRRRGNSAGRFVEANDPRLYQVYAWCFNPDLMEFYGQTKAQTRQWEGALPFYQSAVRLNATDPAGYEALAGLYGHLGRADNARATLEAGLAAAPDTPTLYSALADVLAVAGRKSEARHALERGLVVARKTGDAQAAARLEQAIGQNRP